MSTSRTQLPLLSPRDLSQPLAWRAGHPISAALFIAEAQAVARGLPAGRPINLCQDRYLFALGLAAALLRGQTSLMPPNALPDTLRQVPAVAASDGAPYLLIDSRIDSSIDSRIDSPAPDMGGLPVHTVRRPAQVLPATTVPLIDTDLEAVCLLTSGSTGAPQPHAKRWGALVANIRAAAERLASYLQQPTLAGITVVATVPAQHSYGLESTVLLALCGGAAFDAGRPYYPADIADALQRVPAPRAFVTTPFHLKTLLLSKLTLPPVALTLSATAPLSPQLAAQAETALQGLLVEIYGCTEAGQVASRRTTAGEIWRTLGALHLTHEEHADGERYVVSGGHVTDATPLADVLVLHDRHHFRLLGRANDLIHVAGKRSSLAHLNFHLNRIDGVVDGAFWLPDRAPDQTEGIVRPVAFVVAPSLSAAEIVGALRGQLESAFVPRRVVHVAALPRDAAGKLSASGLRSFALHALAQVEGKGNGNGNGESAGEIEIDIEGDLRVGMQLDMLVDMQIDIAADHPAFAGHFPGQPVLPGVLLLSFVMQALAARPLLAARVGATPRLDSAKFLHPVRPGARLRVALREQGRGVAFEVWMQDTAVARGQIAAASSAGPSAAQSAAPSAAPSAGPAQISAA